MTELTKLKNDLLEIANPEVAETSKRFFKVGKGQYAENDTFIGIKNTELNAICKHYKTLHLDQISELLKDPIHEFRAAALKILVGQYNKTKDPKLFDFYLEHLHYVNNWDLVDSSCRDILGQYCYINKEYKILENLAKSSNLWAQRCSMVANWYLLKYGISEPTFTIANLLLEHSEDIIQKAVGWMLKVAWQRGFKEQTEDFLFDNHLIMNRTAFRIALEKMEIEKKRYFMELK